jgi:uncharacterized protein YbaR (Trm112 family)
MNKEVKEGDLCPNCRNGFLELDEDDEVLVCPECETSFPIEETESVLENV